MMKLQNNEKDKQDVNVKVDERFLRAEGWEIYTGVELIVKGLLEVEGGSHLWTGYPGSPVAVFFDIIKKLADLLNAKGIRGAQANNEALSAAMLNGSQMLGLRGVACMKSVGLQVASDALALGNLSGAHKKGGALVLVGDDPWNESTQVPADSRFLSRHLHMPVMEPSTPQELKDWVSKAFHLSQVSGFYITYLVTTYQADGAGTVQVYPNNYPKINTNHPTEIQTSTIDTTERIGLPPYTGLLEKGLPKRRQTLWEYMRLLGVDTILYKRQAALGKVPSERAPLGFVTSGYAYTYLEQALSSLGLEKAYPILKLGITYPIDPQSIMAFVGEVDMVFVVEEKRSFIEEQILSLFNQKWHEDPQKYKSLPPVYGKIFPNGEEGFHEALGFSPSMVIQKIAAIIERFGDKKNIDRLHKELQIIKQVEGISLDIPFRFPTFCPGCPHRDSASVLKAIKKDFMDPVYMRYKHRRKPVDLLFHGDTGCYSMLAFEPNTELMHNYSGMGLGGGTGAGIDAFITNKQLVFMGDGTFFHSGKLAISNAIKSKQDITFIILDNATTAMTGHQPTPGIHEAVSQESTPLQQMEAIAKAIGKEGNVPVISMNPEDRDKYRMTLEKAILMDGVKVMVAQKECGIVVGRRRKRQEFRSIRQHGFLPVKTHMNITDSVCEHCLECTHSTGCPGLTLKNTDYGPKIQIDFSWCVNDGACMKTEVCPSFEKVTVKRKHSGKNPLEFLNDITFEEPTPKPQMGDAWHVHLSGIGGTGLGVLSGTISRAAVKEGYRVRYSDKKGLAIRCGSVFSNILVYREGSERSSVIPYGKADLLIGLDLMEATRSLMPANGRGIASQDRTVTVVNAKAMPTIANLLGKKRHDQRTLLKTFKKHIKEEGSLFMDIDAIGHKYFASHLYNNLILLGMAYQKGHIPLKEDSLLWAIKTVIGKAVHQNLQAFKLGRYLVTKEELFVNPLEDNTYPSRRRYFLDLAKTTLSKRHYADFQELLAEFEHGLDLSEEFKKDLIRRVYDLICHTDSAYAKQYLDLVKLTLQKDTHESRAATKAVIWNLAKLMLIKDEVYVAHLLTSVEKYANDRRRYDIDPDRGDKISYIHYNKPQFDIGPFHIRFRVHTRDWMLSLFKRAKFIRRMLPKYHLPEKLCRDWYMNLVKEFAPCNQKEYDIWVKILSAPESVTGYREVRYPKQAAMKQQVYDLLIELNKNKPSDSNPIDMLALFQKEPLAH